MHWFDILIAIIAIAAVIKGFSSGLITQLASLAGIVLGAIFAGKLAEYIAPWLMDITGGGVQYMKPLSYIGAFLIIMIALTLVGRVINNVVKAVQLGFVNRLMGSVFCGIKWLVIASIILNLAVLVDRNHLIIKEDTYDNAHTYPLVKELTSSVIPFFRSDSDQSTTI